VVNSYSPHDRVGQSSPIGQGLGGLTISHCRSNLKWLAGRPQGKPVFIAW
jgi:hypothetical protein